MMDGLESLTPQILWNSLPHENKPLEIDRADFEAVGPVG